MSTTAPNLPTETTTERPAHRRELRPTLATAGSLLAATSVAAELIHPIQAPDGSTTQPLVLALYVSAWTIGWTLVAVGGLLRQAQHTTRRRSPATGRRLVATGAVALALSGAGQVITILTGTPTDAMFALFLLGLPLLIAGCVVSSLALRSTSRAAAVSYAIAALGLLVALVSEADPFHDIGLIGGLIALATVRVPPATR